MAVPDMPEHESLKFSEGIMISGSNCEIDGIGHAETNVILAYDFKGTIARICPRPWCREVINTVAVDDLTSTEYDDFMALLHSLSEPD